MKKGIHMIENLLSKMTLEEKIAQLGSVHACQLVENGSFSSKKANDLLRHGIGQITRLIGDPDAEPQAAAEIGNAIQRFLKKETRLQIPAIIHEECLSGLTGRGATVFPQAIGLASTFCPELVEKMTAVIRKQIRSMGGHQGLAPVLDIPRDPRWGRTEETFGEDPYLVSRLGVAYIQGLQGEDLQTGVMATAKHFTAYGISEGGRNMGPARAGERELREVFLFPFEVAVKEAQVGSVMNAYHHIDGIPCTASQFLLTKVLREEWGFSGIVVSDYEAIKMLETLHHVVQNSKEAAQKALQAGIDIELPDTICYGEPLLEAVWEGLISEELINEVVRRVLTAKLHLGLFEDEIYINPVLVPSLLDPEENRQLALEIAQASIILLKNDGLLPLKKDLKTLVIIGPNAREGLHLHGDYSYSVHIPSVQAWKGKKAVWQDSVNTVNIFEGIKNKLPQGEVLYAKGCDLSGNSQEGFEEALEIAKKAQVIVAVMGENSGLFQQSISGEGSDRSDLELPGMQRKLLRELSRLNKPIILVLVNGRPLALQWEKENIPAIIETWYPGEEGGNAIADVLFGDYNPGGKLPFSFPKELGQLPVYYNRVSLAFNQYISTDAQALFPFGHGLSYTRFEYSDLNISPKEIKSLEKIAIQCKVKNIGHQAGDEVIQLYIQDPIASLVRPVKELKGFKRIHLEPDEERTIVFTLFPDQLAFYDEHMRLIIEPGLFYVMVGSSSEDIRLSGQFEAIKEFQLTKYRHFKSEVIVQ